MMLDNTIKIEANSLSSLVNTEHNRNNTCGRWTLIGQKNSPTGKLWGHVRLYCKKWTCPFCGPSKAAKLRKAIIENAVERKMNRMMTLTLNPSVCAAEESVEHIKKCWNKLRTYLRREFGRNISFLTVLEFHKSGYAHMHILVDQYIEQPWLSSTWQALGGGKIVHMKYVDIHRIAHYLSKYLTKQTFLNDYGKNRRYTTSRNMTLFAKKVKEKVLKKKSVKNVSKKILRKRTPKKVDSSKKSSINRRDFETFQFGVERLKELKKELDSLDTRGFTKDENEIRDKLKNVSEIPNIEKKLKILRLKISKKYVPKKRKIGRASCRERV